MGLYLGIGGVVTFNNARKVKEVVEYAPLEQIVLETDSPYLSPVPYRGKRNCSLNLPLVAEEIGRIKGIKRAPLGAVMPTAKGPMLLVDAGANMDAKAEYLLQFAQMGSIYMEDVLGIKNPRVGLVNVGVEEAKGNQLVKETGPLLKECENINYIGSIEAREIPYGAADVVVCDAFAGNIVLKLEEGLAAVLVSQIKEGMMSTLKSKIGALLAKPALKKTLKKFDASEYGGAPLLGLNGLVVKAHGSSSAKEMKNAIIQCIAFAEEDITQKIKDQIVKG